MRRSTLALLAVFAMSASLMPAAANPLSQRDMTKVLTQAPKRYLPSEAGKKEQLTFLFGPYVIPPGQDSNRITADFQLPNGFVTSVSPDLVDASSGRVPTEQEAHIHHAHWFRVTNDPDELYYSRVGTPDDVDKEVQKIVPPEVMSQLPPDAGLSWVFGTGEEKTQGGFELRERLDDANGDGVPDQRYGIEIDQAERQLLIYMIHNKTAGPLSVFVVLDVEFTHGTAAEIEDATGVPMHALKGQLFGRTSDALRKVPTLVGSGGADTTARGWTSSIGGTAIVAGGHAHPGAYGVFVTNQGPDGKCKVDVDGDGFPGITILRSRKIDHVPGSWPYSEDFQMGVAKYGWRAPIHQGDVITQYGVYDIDNEASRPWLGDGTAARFALPGNYEGPSAAALAGKDTVSGNTHQHYEAMNHMGIYIDPKLAPQEYSSEVDANGCPVNFGQAASAYLLGQDTPAVQQRLLADDSGIPAYFAEGITEGMQNHVWPALDPTCGNFAHAERPKCENAPFTYPTDGSGIATDTIHIAGFQYLPGQSGAPGAAGTPARVKKGTVLNIVNEDAAANIRHTLTTCKWPCTGLYVSNYPFPDGQIDTGKLGNIDPVDGGLSFNTNGARSRFQSGDHQGAIDAMLDSETVPLYRLNTQNLDTGFYSYYCRIHPFMRGALEVY